MATAERRPDQGTGSATHEVFNQSSPLAPYNPFEADRVLEAVRREGAEWAEDEARELGAICGRPDVIDMGRQANENPPRLRTHDRFGYRVDQVAYDPSYHELMTTATRFGLHGTPWLSTDANAHLARAVIQLPVGCRRRGPPVSDHDDVRRRAGPAPQPTLSLASRYVDKLGARGYDPSFRRRRRRRSSPPACR